VSRTDHCDPVFHVTFSLTHACFSRFLGDRFLRENTDPYFALSLQMTVDRNTSRLNLLRSQFAALQGLDCEVTEGDRITAFCFPADATLVDLSVFGSVRYECHLKRSL